MSNDFGVPEDPHLFRMLQSNNIFFDRLVDMIPAKLYVPGNTGDEMYNPKYLKGQHKESKEARRARNKAAKLAKFDPNKAETTRQAQERKAREDLMEDDDDSSEEDQKLGEEEHDDDDDDDASKHDNQEPRSTPVKGVTKGSATAATEASTHLTPNQSRIEALRAKLRAKIAEKQAGRPSADSATISKRAARRAEKQKRLEQKRKAPALSSRTTKVKASGQGVTYTTGADAKAQPSLQSDLAQIDFGGLAGLKQLPHHMDNKSLANLNKKQSLQKMLADAEKKQKRLEELKASGEEEKRQALEWGDALKQATGERVAQPQQLRKALKKKAKQKAKSAEAWKSRTQQVQHAQAERQKMRRHNLTQRSKGGAAGANLSKKRIITDNDGTEPKKKRARAGPHSGRAGFEGKKQDFINKKGGTAATSKK